MTVLSMGMALVRQWLPDLGMIPRARVPARGTLALEIRGTVTIARAADDRIEASIAGRIRVARKSNGAARSAREDERHHENGLDPEPAAAELRVEGRRLSSGALADARPFLWLRLLDDQGVALSHEVFIGRGVGIEHGVHARINLATLVDPPMPMVSDHHGRVAPGVPGRTRLSSGLQASIVARTYRSLSGPRYHVEVLMLTLLAAGAEFPAAAIPVVPVLPISPARASLPAWAAPAGVATV